MAEYKEYQRQQRIRRKDIKKAENLFGFGSHKPRNTSDAKFKKMFTAEVGLPAIKARDYSNEPMVRVGSYAHL